MYFLTNVITHFHVPFQLPCSIKFHLGKWRPIWDQIFVVLETVFIHSIWRYHLDTLRPEYYYKCDWNGTRIIVIVQQTKKWLVWKIIIIWSKFCHFCHSPVLYLNDNIWWSCIDGVGSHKNTRYEQIYICVY